MVTSLQIGQLVMLIAPFNIDDGWGCAVPVIGSIGEITKTLDSDGEYDVLFRYYPHPAIGDPSWITHWLQIVPINQTYQRLRCSDEFIYG